jgi:hypothetical protein
MEPKFTTSFIPKKQVAISSKGISSIAPALSFSTLISTVIIMATVLFSAGLFLFRLTLEKGIQDQYSTLEKVKQSFEPTFISQATRLNKRIISSVKILDSHLAPSAIFELLEEFTLQTVSFKTFEFSDNIDGKIFVKGSGEGDSFASVVLQSDEFGKSGYMRDVLFSDLQPNAAGNVNFVFEATLDPQLVLYAKGLVPVQNNQGVEELPAVEQLDSL